MRFRSWLRYFASKLFCTATQISSSRTKSYQAPRRVVHFEKLESRAVTASFSLTGATLSIDLNQANERVQIHANGTSYVFQLSTASSLSWAGTNGSGLSASGANLTANSTALAAFNLVNITDSAANTSVYFETGSNGTISDSFNIRLDNLSNSVFFNGTNTFNGSNALSVTVDSRVEVPSAKSLTMTNGNLDMSINMQATPQTLAFSGLMVNNGTIQTTGTGLTMIVARGGTGASASWLNKGVAVISGGKILGGTTGTMSITGYGYTGVDGGIQGQGVFVYNPDTTATISTISSSGANVSVTGYGANSTNAAFSSSMVNAGVVVGGGGTFCGTITSGGAGTVNVTGYGGTLADQSASRFGASYGVYVNGSNATITSGGAGLVTVLGYGGGANANTACGMGVLVNNGTITSGANGSVVVNGTGCTTARSSSNRGVSVQGTLAKIAAALGTGSTTVVGRGGGTAASNEGVVVISGTITAAGSGDVTVTGYGGNNNGTAGDTNYGVQIDSGGSGGLVGKITSSGGNVVVTGTGGGGAADSPVASSSKTNVGVFVNQGGYITAGGSGTVDVTGYGGGRSPGATGQNNYGVQVSASNSTTANTAVFSYIGSSGGAVNVTGFGGGGSGTTSASSGWYNYGVYVIWGGKITSGGNADVTVNGTGGGFGNSSTSSGVNAGVYVGTSNTVTGLGETFPTITSGGNGNVTINGQGGGSTGSGANNWGVGVQAGGLITSGGMGTVSIYGVAGDSATGNQNVGVWVCQTTTSNVSSTVTSGGGNVVVNGTGGGKNSQYNVGVLVSDSGLITAPGTASVSVTGRGGNTNGTSSTQAHGVWVYGSGSKLIRPKITSTNGTVTVTGYGGNTNTTLTSAAGSNYGVYVSQGGEISTGGTAPLTVTGNGGGLAGGTSNDNVGVYVSTLATGNLPGQITSSDGPITVTGYGGGTNANNSGTGTNHGLSIASGGQIKTTGSGTSINITGTGGGGNSTGSASNHGIQIAGCTTLSNFTTTSNGGPITLNATEGLGSQSRGIATTANAVIGNATTSGNITILTNSAEFSSQTGAAINAAGSLVIAPITPGTSVILGCTTDIRGELRLMNAELNTFNAGTIQIGNTSAGNLTVVANLTVPAAANLTLVSNSSSSTGIESYATLRMGAGKSLNISALPAVNTRILGTTALTQYSQVNVIGGVSIAGKLLNLSGSYTPAAGDVFTIANATSLTGTFTGLADGSTTTFNGRTLLVNYTPTAATLTDPAPKLTGSPSNLTLTSGNLATFTANATSVVSTTVQWQVNNGTGWADISGATSTTYSFTTTNADNGNQYRAVFTNTYGNAITSAATLTVQFAPSITTQPTNQTVNDGQTATFTAAATGNPTPTVQWQVSSDGTNWSNVSTGTGGTTNSYTTAALTSTENGYQYRALYTNSVTANVATNAATVTVNSGTSAPSITTQPTNQTATAGNTATFTAAATGNPTPTVQWQVSSDGTTWSDVSTGTGGTTNSYTTAALAAGDNGKQYRAVYTNGVGSDATTNAATLTVQFAPSITTQPTNQTATVGGTATFTAAATGNPTPTVKWQSNSGSGWADIAGATSNSYTTGVLGSGDNGTQYRAIYTNGVGSDATSNAATLTVQYAPSITQNPTNTTVNAGASASFTAAANGNPTPTLKWQVSTNGGVSWSDISGATSATYSFTTAAGDNGNQYRAVFTNGVGSDATSNAATLTVQYAPSITQNPTNTTVNAGASASFTAAANGNPTPTLKWQVSTNGGVSWSDISGATSATYSFTAAAGDNGNQYRAVFTNGVGSDATSTSATLNVSNTPSAPSVNLHPSNTGVVAGQTASFSAAATGNPTPTVKWQSSSDNSSWADISGATSTTYSFTTSAGDNGLYYRAVFENSQGTAATNSARLIVGTVPTFTNPAYMTLAEGLRSGLTVAAPANPSPTLSISSGSLPNGVTFNPTTGLFSGIAAAGTAGTYPITFQATNGVGAPVTQNFILTVTTAVTGFDVSQGQSQRSYIRYLDVTMANSTEAANLASNLSRVRLIKSDLNGIGSTPVALTGQVTAIGNRIAINFGAAGLGASRNSNAADGYYTLGLDLDNDGNFETSLFFHRLFGDANGDGVVDATDDTAVTNGTKTSVPYNPNLDTNGDGTVNSNDVQYVRRALGRRIKAGLLITD